MPVISAGAAVDVVAGVDVDVDVDVNDVADGVDGFVVVDALFGTGAMYLKKQHNFEHKPK